jgi:hypothetical protein
MSTPLELDFYGDLFRIGSTNVAIFGFERHERRASLRAARAKPSW